ncbi:hypothetical protein SCLCIDRAFT_1187606, partial [Scleroderma citrinum Foug A]
RYDNQGTIEDLEEAITLGRAALELQSPAHSWCPTSIYNVADYLRKKFQKFRASADLDEAISLHQSALDLCTVGHSDRSDSLYSLTLCFSNQYDNLDTIEDLEEAITLG